MRGHAGSPWRAYDPGSDVWEAGRAPQGGGLGSGATVQDSEGRPWHSLHPQVLGETQGGTMESTGLRSTVVAWIARDSLRQTLEETPGILGNIFKHVNF